MQQGHVEPGVGSIRDGAAQVWERPVMRVCRFQFWGRGRTVEGLRGSGAPPLQAFVAATRSNTQRRTLPQRLHGPPAPAGICKASNRNYWARAPRGNACAVSDRNGRPLHLPVWQPYEVDSASALHGRESVAAQHLDTWRRRGLGRVVRSW